MDINAIIKNRRSVRSYKSKKVPKKLLSKILDSARWAPSMHNLQPWKFIIPEGDMKKKLINVMQSRRGRESLLTRLTMKNCIKTIENAPVVILVYNNCIFSNKFKSAGGTINRAIIFETQSVACAIQNMLLTVHSFGLGATWFGIPLFREKRINKLFGVKDKLAAIVTIGYPDKKPKAPPRKIMSEIVSFVK